MSTLFRIVLITLLAEATLTFSLESGSRLLRARNKNRKGCKAQPQYDPYYDDGGDPFMDDFADPFGGGGGFFPSGGRPGKGKRPRGSGGGGYWKDLVFATMSTPNVVDHHHHNYNGPIHFNTQNNQHNYLTKVLNHYNPKTTIVNKKKCRKNRRIRRNNRRRYGRRRRK